LKRLFSGSRIFVVSLAVLFSCGYRQNIMFSVPEGQEFKQQIAAVEKNYIIQHNDYLELEVYTNKGERIIDPDLELTKDLPNLSIEARPKPAYLVDINGVAKFPMVGEVKMEGQTVRQAEAMLQQLYTGYYNDAFVILRYVNKRVIVLGAIGGQVIPLTNENINLVEALALATGLDNNSKAQNIRVLRGSDVFVCDLSTFDGYLKNNIRIEPGDVIYVEPIRRPFSEGLRDYGIIISLAASLTTMIVVIFGLQ
jgi:polysaccharide export outer membrane protein